MKDLAGFLDEGWGLIRTATETLQASGSTPDTAQLELYELAFSFAALTAGEELIQYLSTAHHTLEASENSLVTKTVEIFLADALHELESKIGTLLPALSLSLSESCSEFVTATLMPAAQEEYGDAIVRRGSNLLPDLLDEDKQVMRLSVRKLAAERVEPLAQEIHRKNLIVPDSMVDAIRQLGCFGISVPDEFGGTKEGDAEDSIGMVIVTEELSRASLGAAGSLITRPEIMVRALLEGGTEAQKKRWLPGLANGEPLCAISVTEPGTGSDVANVALRASRVESGWKLNGGKTWCTLAGKAGLILVLARTNPNVVPPHRGLSLFVIEKPSTDAEEFVHESVLGGSVTGRAIPTLGYRGMHSFEMFYDDYVVPLDCLVGEAAGENKGFYYTMRGFSGGRLQTAARATGLMIAAFQSALNYTHARQAFGRSIASYPLTKIKLGRMAWQITAIQQFSYAVARLMDRDAGQLEASLVKLLACRSAEWIARETVQLHGGLGYAEETNASRYYVDARVLSIFEGAEETLALKVIGKALLDGVLEKMNSRAEREAS